MCIILNSITRYFFVIFNFKINLLESFRRPTIIITFYHFHFPINLLFFLSPPTPSLSLPYHLVLSTSVLILLSFLSFFIVFCILHFTVFPFFVFYFFHPDLITNVDGQYSFFNIFSRKFSDI